MEPFAGVLVGRALAEAGADVRTGITLTARSGRIKEPPIWVVEARDKGARPVPRKKPCVLRTDRGFCDASPVDQQGRAASVRLSDLKMCGADRAATLGVG